jgi:hypothetical protein
MNYPKPEGEGIPARGLIWKYDYQERLWRFEKWSIGYDPNKGYLLNLPQGDVMPLLATNIFYAMNEAEYHIRAYSEKP